MADLMQQAMEALKAMKEQNISFDDLIPKDTYGLVKNVIASLGQQAWINLGIQPNPITKKIEKDLKQAKLAIDCTVSLCEIMKQYSSPKEKIELDTLVQNLQLNFVQQNK